MMFAAQKQTGTVKRYNRPRGFGFIQTDGGAGDIFLHDADFIDPTPVRVGLRVMFDRVDTPKGARAVNVRAVAP